jgi:GntR family transcriptional regulator, carbon starvation induced regulator
MSGPSLENANGDTLAERVATLIEIDVVRGALAPGARLGIADLATHYGVGVTPVREGLSRLVARGLIIAIGQRGFRVSAVSREDLADITRLRSLIECEALRRSMQRGDGAWEAGIVASLHQLKRYAERNKAGLREGRPDFDTLHKAFHRSLIAACGSPRMLNAHSDLYDQAYRYRRVMMRSFDEAGQFIRVHQELADLVLARRDREATTKLAAHLGSTLALVYPDAAERTE